MWEHTLFEGRGRFFSLPAEPNNPGSVKPRVLGEPFCSFARQGLAGGPVRTQVRVARTTRYSHLLSYRCLGWAGDDFPGWVERRLPWFTSPKFLLCPGGGRVRGKIGR